MKLCIFADFYLQGNYAVKKTRTKNIPPIASAFPDSSPGETNDTLYLLQSPTNAIHLSASMLEYSRGKKQRSKAGIIYQAYLIEK
ncbi:hypothetical protein [Polynucleobacter sp. MWH-UH2A]|uniref:hypothetical protein n=1 Tax=Polynucleobacter sp. MWH-UH2A TaxID=1855617 RepID=UPI001BFE8F18|nr:hypothetical protein [Polynucleobacter sp. MWH-UH2A]